MKKLLSLFFIAIMVFSFSLTAGSVNLKLQSKLLLKIVSYDKNFSRFGDPIKIGVSSDEMLAALKGLGLKIKGKSFAAEKMASPDDIAKFKIVYIDENWKANYGAVADKAKAAQALVFCNDAGFVESGGGAVSFKLINNKPKIVVNLGNAKEQGTDFSSGFLKVTVIIGGMK